MDDNAPKENPPADFNKLDLTQLKAFSFGTQWTQEKPSSEPRREGGDRPRREDRREGGAGPDRRDRRVFRRPAGAPGEGPAPAGGTGAPDGATSGQERRDVPGDRRGRPGGDYRGGGEYRGGPRREGGYGGGGERGPRYGYGGRPPLERGPHDSPYYTVTFYPEDSSFNTLVQTIRKSCRTVELFEIARTVVAKSDRFVVVMTAKVPFENTAPAPAATGAPEAAAPAPAPKPAFHVSVPDGMPFESDDAAVAHVLSKHLDKFFDAAEVEVEPPKGNFQVINRCGVTGELLGPPNYHRYNQIVQQHYTARVGRVPFEAFRSRIETVRDPEVVNQWLAKMKKATRYTWKLSRPAGDPAKAAAAAPADATAAAAPEAPAAEQPIATDNPAPAPDAAVAPPSTTPTFDTLEDARVYLLAHARDKVVRTTDTARFHGKLLDTMPPGEIKRAVEGALERQRRFPLDTANALRGRLRREHFTIFKKGSKGISYVCAVKRKFRVPGQTFADSIGTLISFIEANPMIRASELAPKFLGVAPLPVAKAPEPAAAPPAGEAPAEATPAPAEAAKSEPVPSLSIEDRARMARMQNDLTWLVREGYVTEFIDGRLFAPPPMVEARKKEIESEEHDPENFPEVPASSAPVATETGGEPAPAGSHEDSAEPSPSSEPAPEGNEAAHGDAPAPAAHAESAPAPDAPPESAPASDAETTAEPAPSPEPNDSSSAPAGPPAAEMPAPAETEGSRRGAS